MSIAHIMKRTYWEEAEIDKMFTMRDVHGASWEEIAEQLPQRTADSVRLEYHRRRHASNAAELPMPATPRSSKQAPRIFWSAEEDATILHGLRLHGKHWRKILAMLPGRSDSSVRNRANRLLQTANDGAHANSTSSIKATPQPAEPAQFVPLVRSFSAGLAELLEDISTDADDARVPSLTTASPRVTFEASSVLVSDNVAPLAAARQEVARLSHPRVLTDDARRSRTDDRFRRSRNSSRRESELDELSGMSGLDELSASLKALGLVSGYTGSSTCRRHISLDELEAFATEEAAM